LTPEEIDILINQLIDEVLDEFKNKGEDK